MISFDSILAVGKWILRKLAAFWQNIVGWLQKIYKKIKDKLRKAPEGVQTFLRKAGEAFQNLSRNYVEDQATGEWTCVEFTTPARDSEVPAAIRNRVAQLSSGEVETTDQLELELSSAR